MAKNESSRAERYEKSGTAALYRLSDKNRKKPLFRKIVYFSIAFAMIIGFACFCLVYFFKIDNIIIDSGSKYNAVLLAEKCGISKGDNIILVGADKIKSSLSEDFPYVKDVKIRKELPSTLYIEIIEEEAEYYFEF